MWFVVVGQSLTHTQLFVTLWTPAHQAFQSFTTSWSMLKLISINLIMPSNHLILCCPLLLLPLIFPSIRVFSNELDLCIRWTKYWNFDFQWIFRVDFLLDWLVWSPCCPKDSQESPAPQFKSINSLALSLLYGLALTSIHDYWNNHGFDSTDLCWQSNVSAFADS